MDRNDFDEPTENDKELIGFVVEHCDRWRDYRNVNFLPQWEEYERIFRGEWAVEDKTRDSERSRIVTPMTQQAVETRHAEIMEAIFGSGEYFDIKDDIQDVNGNPMDVEMIKLQMMEDLKKDKFRKYVDQIELLAAIYGTGIAEITTTMEKEYIPATQAIPGMAGQAAIGVQEVERVSVKPIPVNPKNFLWDPNGTTVDDCMGVAIEKYVSIHKVVANIEKGVYRKVNIVPSVWPNLNGYRISLGLPFVMNALPGRTSNFAPRGKRVASIATIGTAVNASESRCVLTCASIAFCML